ncbi:hypothetical protein BV22DRAFT_1017906 [Leucogyrophana mollusca]|uniref:Uncharacterized protein n=1 Tax=Leucogyrophana mollusca TaxID=85980 RepID=A0ACB8BA13_9AGAM|nr:hypothetical protein BV22DRAFT_1017906 [Leucogyrophana mollusca]
MNSVNASTGFSPFQWLLGHSPRILPPLTSHSISTTSTAFPSEGTAAKAIISKLELDIFEAQDNLLAAKSSQASTANLHRGPDPRYNVGDFVMLSTSHRRH